MLVKGATDVCVFQMIPAAKNICIVDTNVSIFVKNRHLKK